MTLFLVAVGLLLCASVFSFAAGGKTVRKFFGCAGVFAGSMIGLIFSLRALVRGESETISLGSPLPALTLALGIDPLSAYFLVAVFGLSLLAALYAWGYLEDQESLLPSLPFFPLLVASMATVVAVRDGFFFLIVWEVMSLASFFLVTAEHGLRGARHAGWIYLIATHLATAFLMAFFILLCKKTGSFAFDSFVDRAFPSPFFTSLLFFFALIGFGTKAGIFPFHVWLPHAHSAAPSYISALMSGVMIKTGIYGLLRVLTFLGTPPVWWGSVLILLGLFSAFLGILHALVQKDLKRLLAYSSIENIGIIMVGMGLGVIGMAEKNSLIMLLGFGGALFHVWNHALFKGLLFFGAGSVIHATHSRILERLGGLLKKMPVTGTTFFMGAVALCGLPPLNGFVSEWLIYWGGFHGLSTLSHLPFFLSVAAVIGIAFAGGLAIVCFSKAFGVVFLGEPRGTKINEVQEATLSERIAMGMLALLCGILGLFSNLIWPLIEQTTATLDPLILDPAHEVVVPLLSLSRIFILLLGLFLILWVIRALIFRTRAVRKSVTWDCGFALPSARMQYTGASLVEPLMNFFKPILRVETRCERPRGLFPKETCFEQQVEDLAEHGIFRPLFQKISDLFSALRALQGSHVQNYLVLIFGALIFLILWEVWFGI
ncbi:MAG: hydrogenase [Deltaproteobacteria bacterium]|nr:hydrogenase [Deltaproteobacteria bacterium]